MGSAILFDDGGGRLGPLTDLRASFEIRTGAMTTLERWTAILKDWRGDEIRRLVVPLSIAEIVRDRHGERVPSASSLPRGDAGPLLVINGRWLAPDSRVRDLKPGQAIVAPAVGEDGPCVLAALLDRAAAQEFLESRVLSKATRSVPADDAAVLERPWDVIRHRDLCLTTDLELLQARGNWSGPGPATVVGQCGVGVAADASVLPGVVLDASSGPIVIDEGAVIRPGSVIVGPVYIGPRSVISERALIKSGSVVGPMCKVGGEVSGCIFQGYSNKVHDGFLGDSFIGEWVNLGALTTNSNLLNTYGEVRARADVADPREPTGMTFLGCIVGDHVKTAILTRLMTGAVIGTGAMISTTGATGGVVPRFAWLTDQHPGIFRIDEFLETARAMMKRRGMAPSPALVARLMRLHEQATRGGLSC